MAIPPSFFQSHPRPLLPSRFILGLSLSFPVPLPIDLVKSVFARVLGDMGEKPVVAEKAEGGWDILVANDAADHSVELLVTKHSESRPGIYSLRMENSPVSLAVLRGILQVTGGVLSSRLHSMGGHEEETIPPIAARLPRRPSHRFAPWKKKRALCEEQNILATIPALTVHDLDAAEADMPLPPSPAFQALHATLLQASMDEALPEATSVPSRKVRL
jgi:hypothetical protein